jgi:hypothetical protein
VRCSELNLESNGLSGMLPASMDALTALTYVASSRVPPPRCVGRCARHCCVGSLYVRCVVSTLKLNDNLLRKGRAKGLIESWRDTGAFDRNCLFGITPKNIACPPDGYIAAVDASARIGSVLPQQEIAALHTAFAAMGGETWKRGDGWVRSDNPCEWFGVRCSDAHVTALDLSSNLLMGTIPMQLSDLSALTCVVLIVAAGASPVNLPCVPLCRP